MEKSRATILASLLFLAAAAMPARADEAPVAAPTPPTGMTMRIAQEMLLGDLSATGDYRASFLPSGKFRVEGVTRLKMMEMELKMTVVCDGATVRQLTATPTDAMAFTLDLERVRKSVIGEDYSPSKTYDPSVYREMLKSLPDKKVLAPETLDGAEAEGYELPLPKGRLSLPSNAPMFLPDPAKVRVWLSPKDGIARKVEMEDAQGRTFMRMLYTEVKTGVEIKPETFELQFPKDVAPMDITDRILGRLQTTRQPAEPPAKPVPPPAEGGK